LPKGPQLLPIRIEGHDCKIWEYSDDQFSCVNSNTKIWGYADRYRTFRFQLWPWAERTKRARSYRPALLEHPLAASRTTNNVGHSPTTSSDWRSSGACEVIGLRPPGAGVSFKIRLTMLP
jgi:hypothetical protein